MVHNFTPCGLGRAQWEGNIQDTSKDREVSHWAAWAKAWRSAPRNTLREDGTWPITGILMEPLFLDRIKSGRMVGD